MHELLPHLYHHPHSNLINQIHYYSLYAHLPLNPLNPPSLSPMAYQVDPISLYVYPNHNLLLIWNLVMTLLFLLITITPSSLSLMNSHVLSLMYQHQNHLASLIHNPLFEINLSPLIYPPPYYSPPN